MCMSRPVILTRFFSFVVILSFLSISGAAQTQVTDSLQNVANQLRDDTTKVNVLIRLANEYFWSGQYNKALETATVADELATKLTFLKGQGKAMTVCGQSNIRMGNYNEAQEFFTKAIKIFSAINHPVDIANNHLYLGQVYDFKAEYNMALEQYRVARDIASHAGDSLVLMKIMNSTGITNFNKGNYEVALQYYLSALKMTPLKGNESIHATINNNIGVVHVQLMQYEEALKYFLRYVDHMKALNGTHGMGVGYMNVGESYKQLGQFDKAITYLTEASKIQSQTGDKKGLALSYSNMGDVFKARREWKSARHYYEQSIALAREIQNDEVLLNPLTGTGEMFVATGEHVLAQQAIHEAREVAYRIGSRSWLERTYLISSKLDSSRGDFNGAYTWFKKYALLSDSLFNEQKSKQVVQMKELYESERKDNEIRLLSESNKLSQLQRATSKKIFTISVIFLSFVILIILYWLAQKTRHSHLLKKQKDELSIAHAAQKQLIEKIEIQKQELARKNGDLVRLHLEKDGLIGVVVHDLRSPLNRIFALSHLVTLSGDVNDEQQKMLDNINKVCEDGGKLIADLLDVNEYEMVQTVELLETNVSALVREHLTHFSNLSSQKDITIFYGSESPSDVIVPTHEHYLKRILDNLISNAIKFSPPGKRVWVTLNTTEHGTAQIVIRDEGPGFSEADLSHLFQKFKKLSARPTAGESSTGLGLSIVKLLVEKIGGSVKVESQEGNGASFIITLPGNAPANTIVSAHQVAELS